MAARRSSRRPGPGNTCGPRRGRRRCRSVGEVEDDELAAVAQHSRGLVEVGLDDRRSGLVDMQERIERRRGQAFSGNRPDPAPEVTARGDVEEASAAAAGPRRMSDPELSARVERAAAMQPMPRRSPASRARGPAAPTPRSRRRPPRRVRARIVPRLGGGPRLLVATEQIEEAAEPGGDLAGGPDIAGSGCSRGAFRTRSHPSRWSWRGQPISTRRGSSGASPAALRRRGRSSVSARAAHREKQAGERGEGEISSVGRSIRTSWAIFGSIAEPCFHSFQVEDRSSRDHGPHIQAESRNVEVAKHAHPAGKPVQGRDGKLQTVGEPLCLEGESRFPAEESPRKPGGTVRGAGPMSQNR